MGPSFRRRASLWLTATVVCLPFPAALVAQLTPPETPTPASISGRSLKRLGVLTVLAAGAMMPLDATIERGMQRVHAHGGHLGNTVANGLNGIGGPGTVVAPLGLMALGWTSRDQSLMTLGIHSMESVALGSGTTAVLKGLIGRSRPSPTTADADDFAAGAGFRSEQHSSLPSGHTTASFALATTLALESSHYAPDHARTITVASYGLASAVGLARMYTSHHWASDVVLGAGIGTLSGLTVERRALEHLAAHSGIAARAVPSSIVPATGGGVTMGWGWDF